MVAETGAISDGLSFTLKYLSSVVKCSNVKIYFYTMKFFSQVYSDRDVKEIMIIYDKKTILVFFISA